MEKSKVYFTNEITPESLVKIYEAFSDYYLGEQYNNRIETFIQRAVGTLVYNEEILKEVAKCYTDLTSALSKIFAEHFGNYDASQFSEKLSGQFAKKLFQMYNEEQG